MKTKNLDKIKEIFDYEFGTEYCDIPYFDIPDNWVLYIDDYANRTAIQLLEKIDSDTLIILFREMLNDEKHELNKIIEDSVNYKFTNDWEDYQCLLKGIIREIERLKK